MLAGNFLKGAAKQAADALETVADLDTTNEVDSKNAQELARRIRKDTQETK